MVSKPKNRDLQKKIKNPLTWSFQVHGFHIKKQGFTKKTLKIQSFQVHGFPAKKQGYTKTLNIHTQGFFK